MPKVWCGVVCITVVGGSGAFYPRKVSYFSIPRTTFRALSETNFLIIIQHYIILWID